MKLNQHGYRKPLYAADLYYIKLQLFTTREQQTWKEQHLFYNTPGAVVGIKKPVSYSLEELKYGDIWSLGMLLFKLLNPDQKFPYFQEMEDHDVESASEAKDVIGKLMDKKKKPAHSTKYDSLCVARKQQETTSSILLGNNKKVVSIGFVFMTYASGTIKTYLLTCMSIL
ncbi:Hypothetical predicted protein [Paramuricea clavata]|uniref:Uncharacterized protein n=1 Tax=Paramuricea clavata TaxID=317549 RepID=A0A7D9J7U4_PARCT|nr:Hypothetical predicted protein [Paramuricea clavata]